MQLIASLAAPGRHCCRPHWRSSTAQEREASPTPVRRSAHGRNLPCFRQRSVRHLVLLCPSQRSPHQWDLLSPSRILGHLRDQCLPSHLLALAHIHTCCTAACHTGGLQSSSVTAPGHAVGTRSHLFTSTAANAVSPLIPLIPAAMGECGVAWFVARLWGRRTHLSSISSSCLVY